MSGVVILFGVTVVVCIAFGVVLGNLIWPFFLRSATKKSGSDVATWVRRPDDNVRLMVLDQMGRMVPLEQVLK